MQLLLTTHATWMRMHVSGLLCEPAVLQCLLARAAVHALCGVPFKHTVRTCMFSRYLYAIMW